MSRLLGSISLVIGLAFTQSLFAKSGLTINSGEGAVNPMANLSLPGATQRTSSNTYKMQFRASCFATNLRGVANPVSPRSVITMTGKMQLDNSPEQSFSITFDAKTALTTANATGALSGYSMPAGSKAGYSGNTVIAEIPSTSVTSIDPVTAEIIYAQNRFKIKDIKFTQTVPNISDPTSPSICFVANCSMYAYSGTLSSSQINFTQSSDGKTIDIETSFPGEEGYCGGYHSPLMVFLDEKIPQFNNVVNFNMGSDLQTSWPEKNHEGYFVALPNKLGRVTSNQELFGESASYHNGFEKLAEYDSNKDGVIDAKDPVYKKLILWKDKSGKGVYNKNHAIPLAKFVKSINLKFTPNIMQVSANVELREKSTVVMNEPSKYPKAYIVDVWFRPVLETNKIESQKLTSK